MKMSILHVATHNWSICVECLGTHSTCWPDHEALGHSIRQGADWLFPQHFIYEVVKCLDQSTHNTDLNVNKSIVPTSNPTLEYLYRLWEMLLDFCQLVKKETISSKLLTNGRPLMLGWMKNTKCCTERILVTFSVAASVSAIPLQEVLRLLSDRGRDVTYRHTLSAPLTMRLDSHLIPLFSCRRTIAFINK